MGESTSIGTRRDHGFFVQAPEETPERSDNIGRRVIGTLLAPAFGPILLCAYELAVRQDSYPVVLLPFTVLVSYWIALTPAALLMLLLHHRRWLKLWHFAAGGSVLGVFCTSLFVLFAHGSAWSSSAVFVGELLELHPLLIAGPIVGAITWLISEWRPTSKSRS